LLKGAGPRRRGYRAATLQASKNPLGRHQYFGRGDNSIKIVTF
jgi:hypothetical protein